MGCCAKTQQDKTQKRQFSPSKFWNEPQKEHLRKFGIHLGQLRKKKNLSLRKLAANCDVEYADFQRYETGEINMSFVTFTELAKGLEMPLKELMDF